MKYIIFGIGKYYLNRKRLLLRYLNENDKIVAFIDNSVLEEFYYENQIVVTNPKNINKFEFDYVLLMSAFDIEMTEQLVDLGINKDHILTWKQYECTTLHKSMQIYGANNTSILRNRILILTHELKYGGASVAAWNASKALRKKGYSVMIGTPSIDNTFVEEIVREGCEVAYIPVLPDCGMVEKEFIGLFDVVIINTLVMHKVIWNLAGEKPLIWWLHEPQLVYDGINISEVEKKCFQNNSDVYGVSNRAFDRYRENVGLTGKGIIEFGIEDEYVHRCIDDKKSSLIIAVIGNICSIKGQLMTCEATSKILDSLPNNIELWLIGRITDEDYADKVKDYCTRLHFIKLLGERSHGEIQRMMQEIDIIICPSVEESMSITIVEGMMNRKICIVSDGAGISEYIEDGKNGFVFTSGNTNELYQKMSYCVQNFDGLDFMRENARKTYEEIFTLEKFGQRLEKAIISVKRETKE